MRSSESVQGIMAKGMPLEAAYWARSYRKGLKWRGKSWKVGEDPERIFINEVKANVDKRTKLLDIGCGTGKTVKLLAPRLKEAWGIDPTPVLIKAAKKGAPPNARFRLADGRALPFPDESFDVVICQRGPATDNMRFAREMSRVLKQNGTFIAIYIGEHDKENIKYIFKRGQFYNEMFRGESEARRHTELLRKLGFRRIKVKELNVVEYFAGLEDLVSRLERVPIIPNFHGVRDKRLLRKVEMKIQDKKGLRTNSHRIILTAVKLRSARQALSHAHRASASSIIFGPELSR